ncbi:hypothetical protein V4P56_03820 [Bartonella sp. B35(2025)]
MLQRMYEGDCVYGVLVKYFEGDQQRKFSFNLFILIFYKNKKLAFILFVYLYVVLYQEIDFDKQFILHKFALMVISF